MKLLYTNDWHITDKRPLNRIDKDFFTNQFLKVKEIMSIAKQKDVSVIVHGGDWFDSPRVSLSVVNEILGILRGVSIPIRTVIGNHDIEGYNIDSVSRTALGTLLRAEVVVQLPLSHHDATISGVNITTNHTVDCYKDIKNNIIVTHNLVSPTKVMYDHILCDTLAPYVKNKIVLCGHKHMNFIYKSKEHNCLMVNTGCLVRTSLSEKDHMPYVVIIDTEAKTLEKVFLKSAGKGNDVFDISLKQETEKTKFDIDSFLMELKTTKFSGQDIEEIFRQFVKGKDIEKEVLDEIYSRLQSSH